MVERITWKIGEPEPEQPRRTIHVETRKYTPQPPPRRTIHTETVKYEPPEELTPFQATAVSKFQTARERYRTSIERRRFDPGRTYYEPAGAGYRHVSGADVLKDIDKGYSDYWKGQTIFQKELKTIHPQAILRETKGGYKVQPPPSMVELITGKYEKTSSFEQAISTFMSPIVQTGTGIINFLTGKIEGKKGVSVWTHPVTGRPYYKEKLTIGYAPIDTYIHPYTGARYSYKDDVFQKVDSKFIDTGEIFAKLSTGGQAAISYLFPSPGSVERRDWYTKEMTDKPWLIPFSIGGEVAALWGFGKGLKVTASPLVKYVGGKVAPHVTPYTTKIGQTLGTGFKTGLGRGSKYAPSSLKNIYSKLFGEVVPGSFRTGRTTLSTMLSPTTRYTSVVGSQPLRLQGGVLSRFMYYSPKQFGLSGVFTPPMYGASVVGSRGLFRGIRWAGKDTSKGWGTLGGSYIDKLTAWKRYYPWSRGGNVFQSGEWLSKKAISELQKLGTTQTSIRGILTGEGLSLQGTTTTIGKPYGILSKKVAVTSKYFQMGYMNIDKYMPNILRSFKPSVDYSFFGMGRIIKPTVYKGAMSVLEKPLTPATWSGTPTQLRGFAPKGGGATVSRKYLQWLDSLEPDYKSVSIITPHQFPKIYLHTGRTGGRDILSGLMGAGAADLYGGDLLTGTRRTGKYKRDSGLKFQTDMNKYLTASMRGTGTLQIPGQMQGISNINRSANSIMQDMMQGMSLKQASLTKSAQMQRQRYDYTTAVTIPRIPLWFPSMSLGGRGRKFYGDERWGKKYKFRKFTVPSLSKILKEVGI